MFHSALRTTLAATLLASCAGAAMGQTIDRDLWYTRYADGSAANNNVKRVTTHYDTATNSLTLTNITNIALTPGADGIVFTDPSHVLVGCQGPQVALVNINDGTFQLANSGQGAAFHVIVDPSETKAWVAGIPAGLAEVPLNPFAAGTAHALTGDDTVITHLAFTPQGTFYTASGSGGHGNFGRIDLSVTPAVTTRLITDLEAAHGMQFDTFSGNLILCGETLIAQIDPAAPGAVKFSKTIAGQDFDQLAVDGNGLIYAAGNNGFLTVIDYSAQGRVDTAQYDTEFLDSFLDDVAPLIGPGTEPECCDPWDNGAYDGSGAQTSQVGVDQDWQNFSRITADDFYLCDGNIYLIDKIKGVICTDSVVPKALVYVWPDCNGRPGPNPIAILSSAPQVFEGRPIESSDGTVIIEETGQVNADGFRILNVSFCFDKPVILRGGTYWVTIAGFSGNANPLDQFFWGYSRQGLIQGRPGAFYDSDVGAWEDVDTLCCGCTDFAFCVLGDHCKLLLDNASPVLSGSTIGDLGAPSLQNGTNTSTASRAADDLLSINPDCDPTRFYRLCFYEAYLWSNCDKVAVQFFLPGCHCPSNTIPGIPPSGIEADCVTDTGERFQIGNITLKLLKAQWFRSPVFVNIGRGNLWLSFYGLGENRQNARAYLAYADRCDRECDIFWNAGCTRGPAFNTSLWVPGTHDFAIAVATAPADIRPPAVAATPTCPADINRSGSVTVQDLFDFLSAFFAGCP